MITWTVNVVHPEKMRERVTRYRENGLNIREFLYTGVRDGRITEVVGDPDHLLNADTWGCERYFAGDEASANNLAQILSVENPGAEVYVAEIRRRYTATINAPTVARVTAQGVLPE